jgi:hypothetical protein
MMLTALLIIVLLTISNIIVSAGELRAGGAGEWICKKDRGWFRVAELFTGGSWVR